MPLIEEKFDQHKIDSLKRYLVREAEKGRKKDFEIMVDGFKVVSRTDSVEEFDDYEQEVKDATRNISILIFDGPNTNRNTRYSFLLRGEPVASSASLNGLGEIDQVIASKLEEREREHNLQRLQEKLKDTQEQLEEAEDYAQSLEQRIKDMEDKRFTNAISLGELATAVFKNVIRQHAEKIPGGQALAGLLGADIPEHLNAPFTPSTEPVTAHFAKEVAVSAGDLPEEIQNRLSLIAQMQERFNEQQMVAVFAILDHLAIAPDKIMPVIDFLGIAGQPTSAAA